MSPQSADLSRVDVAPERTVEEIQRKWDRRDAAATIFSELRALRGTDFGTPVEDDIGKITAISDALKRMQTEVKTLLGQAPEDSPATVLDEDGLVDPQSLIPNPLRALSELVAKLKAFGMKIAMEMSGNGLDGKGLEIPQEFLEIMAAVAGLPQAHAYGTAGGLPLARAAVSESTRQHGCEAPAENIYIVPGAIEGYRVALDQLKPGLTFALPRQCHPSITSLTRNKNPKDPLLSYPVDPVTGEPDLQSLEMVLERQKGRVAAIYINTPANPSGLVLPEETMRAIARLANKHGVFIISDEIYEDLVLDEKLRHISMGKIAEEEGVAAIVLDGMAKKILAGGDRIGWMIFYGFHNNKKFADLKTAIFTSLQHTVCPPVPPQAGIPFLNSPEFDAWLKGYLVPTLRDHYNAIDTILRPAMDEGLLQLSPLGGAMYSNMLIDFEALDLNTLTLPEDLPPKAREIIENGLRKATQDDEKLFWHLVANGAGFLPLSGFNVPDETSNRPIPQGLRGTLLECDEGKREQAYGTLVRLLLQCKK